MLFPSFVVPHVSVVVAAAFVVLDAWRRHRGGPVGGPGALAAPVASV